MKMKKEPKKITSLEQYIKKINGSCFNKKRLFPETIDNVWFRGESDIYPNVIPSLFRGDFDINHNGISVRDESNLIEKVFQFTPELFSHCNNAIERLVTMQHYTLPTRLLDVTKNPLVALFFACEGNEGKDGRVLFTKRPKSDEYDLNIIATIIESFGYNDMVEIDTIYNALKKSGLYDSVDDPQKELRNKWQLCNTITEAHLYLPKYNNPRIKNQRGAVICAPLFDFWGNVEECKKLLKKNIKKAIPSPIEFKFQKQPTDLSNLFINKPIIIDGEYKANILKELDNYGINVGFVYPEYEHQMQYIKRYCTTIRGWNFE